MFFLSCSVTNVMPYCSRLMAPLDEEDDDIDIRGA
jgi:hypothetical protein